MPHDQLSVVFAALADTTRRAILDRLAQGESTVKELAEPFDISAPAITKHLKVLQRAGLIEQGRRPSGAPVVSPRLRFVRWLTGSTATALFGKPASIGSMPTWARYTREKILGGKPTGLRGTSADRGSDQG